MLLVAVGVMPGVAVVLVEVATGLVFTVGVGVDVLLMAGFAVGSFSGMDVAVLVAGFAGSVTPAPDTDEESVVGLPCTICVLEWSVS
jgi:hypothetical protein